MWKHDDEAGGLPEETQKSFFETISEYAAQGADLGGSIGSVFGKTGETIGRVVGGVVGAAGAMIESGLSFLGRLFG